MRMEGFYGQYGKRLFDIVASAAGLIALAPLLCALAVAVRIGLGSPVLFRQSRIGRQEGDFTILKFRSMTDARDASGKLLPDTARMTGLGRLLRATSLDELPELWNVLIGEMSLVGPRPLLPRYQPWYTPVELKRFAVRPGITGWAQVNGRNSLSWDERFQRDVEYVETCSFTFDLKILYRTVGILFQRQHVHVDTSLTLRSLDDERRERFGKPVRSAMTARGDYRVAPGAFSQKGIRYE